MGIRRSSTATKSTPDADSYLPKDEETFETPPVEDDDDESHFEAEDENEIPVNAGIIQSGWGAAQKKLASSSSSINSDFRVTTENQLVCFLASEPQFFMQHWIERKGKMSFICIGKACPLCNVLGDKPSLKYAFQIVNLSSEDDEIVPQWWIAGTRVFQLLSKYHSDPKVGPLERGYFSVSKTGTGAATVHTIAPVKERDLADDWDLDVAEVKRVLGGLTILDPSTLRPSSLAELKAIAQELS